MPATQRTLILHNPVDGSEQIIIGSTDDDATLITNGWSPQTAFDDQPVVEQLTVNMLGTTAADVLARTAKLQRFLRRARRRDTLNGTGMTIQYRPVGSEQGSPLQSLVIDAEPVALSASINDNGLLAVPPGLDQTQIQLTRRGRWYGVSDSSSAQGDDGSIVTLPAMPNHPEASPCRIDLSGNLSLLTNLKQSVMLFGDVNAMWGDALTAIPSHQWNTTAQCVLNNQSAQYADDTSVLRCTVPSANTNLTTGTHQTTLSLSGRTVTAVAKLAGRTTNATWRVQIEFINSADQTVLARTPIEIVSGLNPQVVVFRPVVFPLFGELMTMRLVLQSDTASAVLDVGRITLANSTAVTTAKVVLIDAFTSSGLQGVGCGKNPLAHQSVGGSTINTGNRKSLVVRGGGDWLVGNQPMVCWMVTNGANWRITVNLQHSVSRMRAYSVPQ